MRVKVAAFIAARAVGIAPARSSARGLGSTGNTPRDADPQTTKDRHHDQRYRHP